MNKVHRFKLENGVNCTVSIDESPDWSWLDAKTDPEGMDRERVRRGDLYQVAVSISMYDTSGEVEGSDYISGVTIDASQDLETQARQTVTEYGMAENARADLKDKLKRIIEGNR